MIVDTLLAQITHEAPSTSIAERPLLPICCLCRLIRDETGTSLERALGHAADVSKNTWRQSGRLHSHSRLLSGVFHADDGDNEGSPNARDADGHLARGE